MTDKTKSQTFQKIIEQQDIKDILNQPNVTFKNNRGKDKQRHGGLTIKFFSDTKEKPSPIVVNDDLSQNEIFYDAVDNFDTEKISQIQTITKEVATQTNTTEEKCVDDFSNYANSVVTILENKKISKLRKKIFDLKQALNDVRKNNEELSKEIQKNNSDLKIKYKELSKEIQNKSNSNNTDRNKTWFKNKNIKNIENKVFWIGENNKELFKKNTKNNNEINKFESNICQLNQKLDKYINELSIPATPPALWIDKSNKITQLHKKMQKVTTDKEFYKIRKKIDKIDNQMIKIWDGKKVEKIYEEILPIEDKIFFITTFIHANQSISEETIFLHDFGNNNFKVVKQTKHYQHIKEYTKNLLLIDKENKEEVFKFTPIKNLLKEHNDLKLKPTKKEKLIWVTSVLLPTIALIIGVFHPPILILGVIGLLFKLGTSFVSPSIKKVESWWYNKKFKNQAKNEREKRERESIIKDLTSDKKEIRLKMQFKILKQEVDNRKVKNSDELISCKTINNNFDLFIRNTVNQQELPSPATKIHHSNSIS